MGYQVLRTRNKNHFYHHDASPSGTILHRAKSPRKDFVLKPLNDCRSWCLCALVVKFMSGPFKALEKN
jgi:hypothetical protein